MVFLNEESKSFIDSAISQSSALDFSEIFKTYKFDIFSLVYSILGNYEEAMDVTQDVFIKVFEKLDTFQGKSSVKTWIFKIAINFAKNKLRSLSRKKWWDTFSFSSLGNSNFVLLDLKLSSRVETPEERYKRLELKGKIFEALKLLPLKSRILIVMKDIEGFSYEEISNTLDIPMGTVKSRLFRAREELKKMLEEIY